jgi:hypothetical protein
MAIGGRFSMTDIRGLDQAPPTYSQWRHHLNQPTDQCQLTTLMTRTSLGDVDSRSSAVLPKIRRAIALRPCDPITRRSRVSAVSVH